MDIALLVARLLLAVVFAVAGLAKLADLKGAREALVGFGVPRVLAGPFGILLPLAELAVAALLIPTDTAAWAAAGALVLLGLFIIGISVSMARGVAPDCHCFGQLHSEPAGWRALIRNVVLGGVAAFAAIGGWDDPGKSAVAWIGDLSGFEQVTLAAGVVMAVAIIALAWLLLHALGQNGRLLLRIEALENVVLGGEGFDVDDAEAGDAAAPARGLPVGAPAPAFALSGMYGEVLTLDALRAQGKPVMLIFSDPNCGPCTTLLPDIAAWQREHMGALTIAMVSRGSAEANRDKAGKSGVGTILLQKDREVAEAYNAPATPSAVIVGVDGTIASTLAEGAQAIRLLVSRTAAGSAAAANGGQRANVPMAARSGAVPAQPVVPNAPAQQVAQPAAPARPPAAGDGTATPRPAPTRERARPRESRERSNLTGQPAPSLNLPDLQGNMVSLESFRGRDTAVLFWNPGCGFCRRMLDDLKAWEANPPAGAPQLLVVSTGTVEANAAQGIGSTVVLDQGFTVGRAFGATGTPSAVLVDSNGVIKSGVGVGADAVLAILRGDGPAGASADNGGRAAPLPRLARMGDEAPSVVLPDLSGRQVDLASFRGQKTLVLFWNPGCGFCRRMLDDLKAWEANPPKDAPQLLVVSTGTVEANEQMGLNSTIVLDQGFSVGRAFGATGTPSAVMIDHRGRISSPVAAGAPAVLELAGWRGTRAVSV